MIRNDPPSKFPWTKALGDMKKFAPMEDEDIILYYVGDGKAQFVSLCDFKISTFVQN